MKGSAVRVRASAPRKALETGPFSVGTALCDRLPPAVVRSLRRKARRRRATRRRDHDLYDGDPAKWVDASRLPSRIQTIGQLIGPVLFMAPRSRPIASEVGRSEDYAGGLVHELREGLAEHVLEVAGDELPEGPRSRLEQSARSSGRAWGASTPRGLAYRCGAVVPWTSRRTSAGLRRGDPLRRSAR